MLCSHLCAGVGQPPQAGHSRWAEVAQLTSAEYVADAQHYLCLSDHLSLSLRAHTQPPARESSTAPELMPMGTALSAWQAGSWSEDNTALPAVGGARSCTLHLALQNSTATVSAGAHLATVPFLNCFSSPFYLQGTPGSNCMITLFSAFTSGGQGEIQSQKLAGAWHEAEHGSMGIPFTQTCFRVGLLVPVSFPHSSLGSPSGGDSVPRRPGGPCSHSTGTGPKVVTPGKGGET